MKFLPLVCGLLTQPASATIEVDGVEIEVVDAHLHTLETPGDFNLEGKAAIVRRLPTFVLPYYSALATLIGDPYAPVLGIEDQLDWAGVDQAVILAAYTQHSVGFATNRHVEQLVWDPRNEGEGGKPRLLGMASINLDDFEDDALRSERIAALESYLLDERFIGIKLAHAHQAVAFDDPILDEVYEVAARTGSPVLLHTGVSPFPGTKQELEYTSPAGLVRVIERFDGLGNEGRVEFVLSHIGTADARATMASLELAAAYDNVWLEVSALTQSMVFDIDGQESTEVGPQHPWILEDILQMDLVDRTIFASDGPQRSGRIRSYIAEIVDSMQEAGYRTDQMQRVFSGSFYDCFGFAD